MPLDPLVLSIDRLARIAALWLRHAGWDRGKREKEVTTARGTDVFTTQLQMRAYLPKQVVWWVCFSHTDTMNHR